LLTPTNAEAKKVWTYIFILPYFFLAATRTSLRKPYVKMCNIIRDVKGQAVCVQPRQASEGMFGWCVSIVYYSATAADESFTILH